MRLYAARVTSYGHDYIGRGQVCHVDPGSDCSAYQPQTGDGFGPSWCGKPAAEDGGESRRRKLGLFIEALGLTSVREKNHKWRAGLR
jgi:hypothetical protein